MEWKEVSISSYVHRRQSGTCTLCGVESSLEPGMEVDDRSAERNNAQPCFATTRWSLVQAAGASASAVSRNALEELCRTYWQPVYAFIRRTGSAQAADAADLTQSFFANLLTDRSLSRADQERGRFRSFLIGALKHFLADDRDRVQAVKRGGRVDVVSLDVMLAESRYGEPSSTVEPSDRAYDRAWALSVLDKALARLREEFELSGRGTLFDGLKGFLTGNEEVATYAAAARSLRITEGATKMTVTRMRKRFRAIMRHELAQTVVTAEELEEELREFTAILRA